MTTPQAILFLKQKLSFDVTTLPFCNNEKLFSDTLRDYYSGSSGVLIDMKRVLLEVMCLPQEVVGESEHVTQQQQQCDTQHRFVFYFHHFCAIFVLII